MRTPEQAREYYKKNREKIIERSKKFQAAKKLSMSPDDYKKLNCDNAEKWRIRNPERSREVVRNCYHRNIARWKSNPNFRLRSKLRKAIKNYFRHGEKSGGIWFMELACGRERYDMVGSIEPRWGHEFDHVIPLIAFDLTKPEHLLRAAHHTNIAYIPRTQNLKKNRKIPAGLNIELLPYVNTPEAISAAEKYISNRDRGRVDTE